jgi:hypothetical protein
MSKTAFSIFIYSFYLYIAGVVLMFTPNLVTNMLELPPSIEIWIRMFGLLTFTVGIYYYQSAKAEQTEFFKATIAGRYFFFVMTIVLVFAFKFDNILAGLGVGDLIGATWTLWAIKKH